MTTNNTDKPIIAHVIYRLGVGGLENGLINLINQMPAEKYKHLIVCLTESTGFSQRLQDKDVMIVELHKKEGQDWRSFYACYRLLKEYRVDIVHTRNLGCIEYQLSAFFAGIKYRVHSEHGWDVFDPEGNNKKYQWLRRLMSPFIQAFIPLSLHLQAYLVEKVGIPLKKIHRICNGVDTRVFSPSLDRQLVDKCPFPADSESIYIGTVGRMHGVKDQKTLVNAFIQLMNKHNDLQGQVYLLLIGDGPLRQEAIELLERNNLLQYVWMPGERKDIAEIMRSLDIFVLPSQAEGISNTILEAMATGLPVIATQVGGNPELVEQGETGILVPPSNPTAMADAMLDLILDKNKRVRFGEMALKRVLEYFSIDVMVNKYTDVYDSIKANREQ